MLGTASLAILLGDFNDTQGSDMYKAVTGTGFTDAWAALRPGVRGFTCCEPADLSNHVAMLTGRFDDVFARGIGGPQGKLLGLITIVGDQPGDRVPGPLYPVWPSDHAGVVASLLVPPARGLATR